MAPSLISVPPYLLKMIVALFESMGMCSRPVTGAGADGRDAAALRLLLGVSGRTMPLTVVSSSSRTINDQAVARRL